MFIRCAYGYLYEKTIEHSYRLYVTRQLVETANGKTLSVHWDEMVSNGTRGVAKEDGEAVVKDIVTRAGLVVR